MRLPVVQSRSAELASTALAPHHTGITPMKNRLLRLVKNDSGATAIEYGMIAGLIAVGIITVLLVLGPQVKSAFQSISNELTEGGITAPEAGTP